MASESNAPSDFAVWRRASRVGQRLAGFWMVLGAWGVAVVAPLLDIVGRNPDLVVTHRIGRGPITVERA